jgi:hypothetical protein
MFVFEDLLLAATLFVAMFLMQELGRRLGERELRERPVHNDSGTSIAENAVFALLGLFLAFTFSGAGNRFESRYHLVVDEANAIGTAWLRIDLLPSGAQADLRALFRRYADARIARIHHPEITSTPSELATIDSLQRQIWAVALDGAKTSGQVPPFTVLLPAINAMFDAATTREAAARLHPPPLVFVALGTLAIVAALFAGFGTAGRHVTWLRRTGFAFAVAVAIYVIVDFEFPRVGLIRVSAADKPLLDLRRSMH